MNDCVYRKVTPVSYVNPPRKLSCDELKIRAAVDEALGLDALMKKHDLIEEAKRRAMEEGRRLAAEKAREEARLKAEEDARAVAEYYASLGYRVRMKSRFARFGGDRVRAYERRAVPFGGGGNLGGRFDGRRGKRSPTRRRTADSY